MRLLPKKPLIFGGLLPKQTPEINLVDALQRSVDRYPHRVFLQFEKKKISYSKFNALVNRFAHFISNEFQVQKGEKVCLFAQNSIEFPVAFFSILKLGGIVVPINSFFKSEELSHVLENSQSRLLLFSESFKKVVHEAEKGLSSSIKTISLESISSQSLDLATSFDPVAVSPDDLAVFIYTSGTTGKPKGAMLSHRNFLSNIEGALQVVDINFKDRFLVFLPLFHSFTLTVLFLLPAVVGAKILLLANVKNPKLILKGLFLDRATFLAGIPQVYELLSHKKVPFLMKPLLALRFCISGAAPLPETTLKKFEKNWGIPLIEGYGLSEASPIVSFNPFQGVRKPLSVGLPLPNVRVKIIDKQNKEVGVNVEGEICVQGPNVMQGYFNEEKGTHEVLKDGWLLTGDVGKLDEEGYLFILDRKKDLILVRGINVYPREVEEVLKQNPKVKECAVVGKEDPKRGETPVAHLVLNEQEQTTESEMRQWCRSHLANYKVPTQFVFHAELPRTSTGKILKRALK